MNNVLQALAVSTGVDNYQPTTLNMLSEHMQTLITGCLPEDLVGRFDFPVGCIRFRRLCYQPSSQSCCGE
ncbi:hypothetical protein [Paraburkholderia sp. RL17-347-BIC-D]|uniref:hypothetical protein n=1 Tax=Paraburkholderia sp. RL17-347-BIC-D TaxID=3031632 RepID=UPI0038B8CCDD